MSLNKVPSSMEVGGGSVPAGGVTGQVLTKNSNADGDAGWSSSTTGDMSLAGTQTVTGPKTFNSGKFLLAGSTSGATTVNASAVAGGIVTMPAGPDTIVGRASVDSLSNKTFVAPVLGTPASGNLVNCTGLDVSSLTGLGANVAALLGTFSSAHLAAALTDETGSGQAVFGTGPTITTPILSGAVAGTFTLPATATLASTPTQGDNSLKLASTAYVDAALGTTQPLSATTLTLSSANTSTYNGNTIAANNASAQTITINSGAGLTRGLVIEQLGAGFVSVVAGGGVTFNAPNGLSTAGVRTTLILTYEAADVYTVYARPTADSSINLGNVTGAVSLDFAKYTRFKMVLTGNVTLSVTGAVTGQHFGARVDCTQDATGGRTVTVSPTPKVPGGTAWTMTSAATKRDVVTITTDDAATTLDLFVVGQDVH